MDRRPERRIRRHGVTDGGRTRRSRAGHREASRGRRAAPARAGGAREERPKEELRSIVKAWNDAFALDAFFNELSRRAQALVGNERGISRRASRWRARWPA